tara:strand:- start:31 stop:1200 length:1170 start_codon:yes stop_codon:yes gene_type:complete
MYRIKKMKTILHSLSSLNLALFSLLGLLFLTVVGTFDQVNLGIYYAQKKYFESLFITIPLTETIRIPIFLGAAGFGLLLVINISAVIVTRQLMKPAKIGLFLVHVGIIVLLIGGGLTSKLATETQLIIEEGETKSYTQDMRYNELIVSKKVSHDEVQTVSFPVKSVKEGDVLSQKELPFDLKIQKWTENAGLTFVSVEENESAFPIPSKGSAQHVQVLPKPIAVKDTIINFNTALVAVHDKKSNALIGTFLVSRGIDNAQKLKWGNETFYLQIRPKRYYTAYQLTLKEFSHDLYPGTNKPKNFSSLLSLYDPESDLSRDVLIYMNHPLRYKGKTYYQASFGKNDTLSVLQVVENPSWLLPYISSLIITLGLLIHFAQTVGRRRKGALNA